MDPEPSSVASSPFRVPIMSKGFLWKAESRTPIMMIRERESNLSSLFRQPLADHEPQVIGTVLDGGVQRHEIERAQLDIVRRW